MRKKQSFGMNIGASSVLVIIIILALICFAGLSLASSDADYQLCLKLADRTRAYYEATSEAYTSLYEASKKEASSEAPFENTYTINDTQSLHISATLNPDDGSNYAIDAFNIVTVSKKELEEKLSLLLD